MLQLKDIVKIYSSGDGEVLALQGVSLEFRKSEFVSILGQSGCGKTTLLNIIGGLDRYTSGDLIINERSTKDFRDSDWDNYRNHSVGFVFQSYNLIPHQTVLANVELALTLSGVSKSERRQRAIDALKSVGLEDQINKKPTQMSGGQMQRVAIARALVNNPDILLADEPTGALDTHTSVQIMEILKEVARDRLVIMVTHNPDLAEEYSTRIVRLSDGLVISDSNPYDSSAEVSADVALDAVAEIPKKKAKKKAEKKPRMSFGTALSLSLNNLWTKKGRTVMTSFAGSIGIIGIALILSLSNGIQLFINQVQEDTLSTFPLTIQKETTDMSAMLDAMTQTSQTTENPDANTIYVDSSLDTMVSALTSTINNDLESFKAHLDKNYDSIKNYVSDIQYTYALDLQTYSVQTVKDKFGDTVYFGSNGKPLYDFKNGEQRLDKDGNPVCDSYGVKAAFDKNTGKYVYDTENGKTKTAATKLGLASMLENMGEDFAGMSSLVEGSGMSGMDIMSEMINNQDLLDQQYEVVKGNWPQAANEVVLVVGKNNQISKLTLYMLGVLPQDELDVLWQQVADKSYEPTEEDLNMTFPMDNFVGMSFNILNASEFYQPSSRPYPDNSGKYIYEDIRTTTLLNEESLIRFINDNGTEIKISGIIRPRVDATSTSISGAIGYTKELSELMLQKTAESAVIKEQKSNPGINVLTGRPFVKKDYSTYTTSELIAELNVVISSLDKATQDKIFSYMTPMAQDELKKFSDSVGGSMISDPVTFTAFLQLMPESTRLELVDEILTDAEAKNPAMMTGIPNLMPGVYESISTDLFTIDSKADVLSVFNLLYQAEEPSKAPVFVLFGRLFGMKDEAGNVTVPGLFTHDEAAKYYTELNELLVELELSADNYQIILGFMAPAGNENMEGIEDTKSMFISFLEQLNTEDTYETNLELFGDAVKDAPASVNFYAKNFESKAKIEQFIADYNNSVDESKKLEYSDLVGSLMSSISVIIDVISYVLVAFVSISLVVSSIMIGIITNISVLERTKEIGILRAIGASKKDVSRVFNAETFIIGACAGVLGIVVTLLLCLPANAIIQGLTGFKNIKAVLPPLAALILVAISMGLTIIAGLIPSRSAAKKDPVEALRSE